jgi:hypothetical protein
MTGRRQRRLMAGTALALLLPLGGAAQETGGLRLTFGVGFRVETSSNLGLETPDEGRSNQIATRLSFRLEDETRAGSLYFAASGWLRALDGPDGTETGFESPDLSFGFRRAGARSTLDVTAFLREADLDTLRGLLVDPDTGDVSVLSGEGTQRQTGGRIAYTFGAGEPLGLTLSAGVTDTTFRDSPEEDDYLRAYLGATLRFALDPATEATLGLTASTYDEEGEDRSDTLRFEAGLSRSLPRGTISATLYSEDTEDGTRTGLSFGQSVDLASGGRLSYSLGATRGVSGDTNLTGAVDWSQPLPRGSLSLGLRRAVTSGEDDAETLATSLSARLTQELTPRTDLSVGLTAAEAEETGTGDTTRTATLSATLTHALTRDWALDAGYSYRWRDEDGEGRATSDTLFLELRREFEWRP